MPPFTLNVSADAPLPLLSGTFVRRASTRNGALPTAARGNGRTCSSAVKRLTVRANSSLLAASALHSEALHFLLGPHVRPAQAATVQSASPTGEAHVAAPARVKRTLP